MKPKRLLSLLLCLTMMMSLMSVEAFAAEPQSYQPGTYTAKANVKNSEDNDDEWADYAFDVTVTVNAEGKISEVACATDGVPSESQSYAKKAVSGTKKATSIPAQIITQNGTDGVNVVSGATYTSDAIIAAAKTALGNASAPVPTPVDKTALQAKVNAAKALTESDYTAESWAALQTALTKAQAVLDNADAAQSDVDAQLTALTAAVDALVKQPAKPDPTPDPTPDSGEYTYLYAALTWAEYWANENVYNSTSTVSRKDIDAHNETDLGGFDAVSRATSNHGLHRGSFQCTAVIEAEDGSQLHVSHWSKDGATLYLTDGTSVGYSKGTITKADGSTTKLKDYKVYGLKYVPVAVKTSDLDAFKAAYVTVENGGTLIGGYGENKLSAYSYTAAVDADTNGLKTATKNADGTFSFSAAKSGTTSGLADTALKTAEGVEPGINSNPGSFGEFLRVDINGNYGDLGASMQSVTWTYYGSDSTYTTPLRTYGTKFAADNWMHKSMGIQLGLTLSDRCQLPAGTDGTGYWSLTVHALGYEDYTYKFQAGADDIAVQEPVTDQTRAALNEAIKKAQSLNGDLYTAESWKNVETELGESLDMLEWTYLYESSASEQIKHLTEAIDNLVGASGYVWMSIPYADFYASETGKNTTAVDVFSSATKSKPLSTLAAGSYHKNADGSDISGIVFPVKLADLSVLEGNQYVTDDTSITITTSMRGQITETTYTGKDALFQSSDYAYYVISGDAPSFYKELTVTDGKFSFGKVQGTVNTLKDVEAELTTVTSYGDYQIDLAGLPKEITTVYGVVLNTTDGYGYGLRHLENIWRVSELAFCTGHTDKVHNCPTSSAHYLSIEGKTIDTITYYTNAGIYSIALSDLYVPITVSSTVSVADGASGDGSVAVTVDGALPADFDAVYSVDGLDVAFADGKLSYENAAPGKYTLEVSDASGKYAPLYTTFVLSTDQVYAAFNGSNEAPALVPADGVSADDFAAYLSGISSVTVNGKVYSATGRGSVQIVKADGTIDLAAVANGVEIFGKPGEYTLTVTSVGYPELTFSFTIAGDDNNSGDNGQTGEDTKPGTDAPKTGDSFRLLATGLTLLCSAAGAAWLTSTRRKRS